MEFAVELGVSTSMKNCLKNESGITLIETMLAILILLVGLLGFAQLMTFSLIVGKSYGRDTGQTTAAARDKMEELIGLEFLDTITNVTVNPPYPNTGTGLTQGGSIYPDAPVSGFSDKIDFSGNRTNADDDVAYIRQWKVQNESTTLKSISVSVKSNRSFKYGLIPSTTLITYKAP